MPPEARRPATGKETIVFSCFNQDQELDPVDFKHLNARLAPTRCRRSSRAPGSITCWRRSICILPHI